MPFPIDATDERLRAVLPGARPRRARPLWPYLVGVGVALLAFLALLLAVPSDEGPTLTPAKRSAATPAPGPVTLPHVAGRNAADVSAELSALGLSNAMITRADGRGFVTDPARWTADSIAPAAGSQVRPDAVVVVAVRGGPQ